MVYRIAVCDDCDTDVAYISTMVQGWAEQSGHQVLLKGFSSAESFWFCFTENKAYDILLLDVEMGGMNGVELAKELRKHDEALQIIFITGYSDYIAEGYEVDAVHYLMKPVKQSKLFAALDRAAERRRSQERVLILETCGEIIRIPLHEISFVEVCKNYVTVHAKEVYTVKRTLGDIEKELDGRFFRTGRSYIVNLNVVRRVNKKEICLADGTLVPLPRGMYEPLNRAIISRM